MFLWFQFLFVFARVFRIFMVFFRILFFFWCFLVFLKLPHGCRAIVVFEKTPITQTAREIYSNMTRVQL